MGTEAVLWIDASAGVAGDMLLGSLVDAVIPGSVRLRSSEVNRAGLRAVQVEVQVLVEDPPRRTWTTIRDLLTTADLPDRVRERALATFRRLAEAEGRVHGMSPEQVHFHEVGALDAIADVVGTCAGVEALGVESILVSAIALGSGTTTTEHGVLPVPAPAVLELSRGWDVLSGGSGELATPTGLALVTSLATSSGPLPPMRVELTGIGAGSRDTPGRSNVVRLVLGQAAPTQARAGLQSAVELEANVDDLDPRLWPGVLDRLLAAGAWDAWLTPILMKKGRPAHTLHVLCAPEAADQLAEVVFAETTTLGLRRVTIERDALDRAWLTVLVGEHSIRIKVGHRSGRLVQAMPEFEDVAAAAARVDQPVRDVLAQAHVAAAAAGLVPGASWPIEPATR